MDAVLTALTSGEPTKIEPFLGYAPRACASSPQIGGPPKCADGEAEGTVAQVVPLSVGEGTYLRQGQDVAAGLQRAFPEGTSIYAVYRREPAPGNFPRGSYVVVTEAPGLAARSVDIEQGKIIYMNLVPSNTATKLVEGIQQNEFVLPPR